MSKPNNKGPSTAIPALANISPADKAIKEKGTPIMIVPKEPIKQAFCAVSGLSAANTLAIKSIATISPKPKASRVAGTLGRI